MSKYLALCVLVSMMLCGPALADRNLIASTAVSSTGFPSALTTVTMEAADLTNLNYIVLTGEMADLLVIHNTGVGSQNVTISSVADTETGRSGDIGSGGAGVAVAAGAIKIVGPFKLRGWSSSGNLNFDADSTDVEFGHIKLK